MLHHLKARYPVLLSDHTSPPQIFDLLQISRKERDCKAVCQRSIRALGGWKKRNKKIDYPMIEFYMRIEGMILRRQAQDAVLLYRLIRKEREKLFSDYLERLPQRNHIAC